MSTLYNGRLLLAGDIGGTKTELAIFSEERGPREPVMEAEFPSALRSGSRGGPEAALLAVARYGLEITP